jgi:hypothetical protein
MREALRAVLDWERSPRVEVAGLPYDLHNQLVDALAKADGKSVKE